ncbi:hypothetical protein CSB45_01295 [candidate division KSB3 bacterium]|uniref:Uncharacterized protein n=1 Tax=candidate division KSB3 bacterium TaxID=2044937 RepID=A0A2G6EAF5_9BACT|nr:MAG: hypothetical protein CSB45_01295 [candidate division KSB3 bacterium]PIE30768.1 MAG: hypothetical protein CSA57_02055 [candidate division KSB3 bacterium]
MLLSHSRVISWSLYGHIFLKQEEYCQENTGVILLRGSELIRRVGIVAGSDSGLVSRHDGEKHRKFLTFLRDSRT